MDKYYEVANKILEAHPKNPTIYAEILHSYFPEQPEAAQDARELAELIAGIAYQSNMRTPQGYEQMTCDIAARLASAREQGEAELLRVNTALAACSETAAERYRMWKEAERKGEEMRAALTDAVKVIKFYAVPPPSSASGHPQRPCDMQAYELLRRIAALATPAEGTTQEGERHITEPDQNGQYGVWIGKTYCVAEGLTLGQAEALAQEATGGKA
jgi:hypothetical protein